MAIVSSRSGIDQPELLGAWIFHGAVMAVIGVVAVLVYRMLRRGHAATREAATLDDERRGRA